MTDTYITLPRNIIQSLHYYGKKSVSVFGMYSQNLEIVYPNSVSLSSLACYFFLQGIAMSEFRFRGHVGDMK